MLLRNKRKKMAILRASEITKLGEKEKSAKLAELRKEFIKIKTQSITGNQKVGKMREIRRTIARLLTMKNRRTIAKE